MYTHVKDMFMCRSMPQLTPAGKIYIYEVGDCSQPLHLGPHWTVSYPNPNRFTLDVTVHTDSVHFYSVTVDEARRCTRFDLRPLTKLDGFGGGSGDEVQILTDFTLRF